MFHQLLSQKMPSNYRSPHNKKKKIGIVVSVHVNTLYCCSYQQRDFFRATGDIVYHNL